MAQPYHRIYSIHGGTVMKARRAVGILQTNGAGYIHTAFNEPHPIYKGFNHKLSANTDEAFQQFLDHLHFAYQEKRWAVNFSQQGIFSLGNCPNCLVAVTDLRRNVVRLDTGEVVTRAEIKARTPNQGG